VINTACVEAGSRVAVVGLGGVGFSALLAALASGARDVIAIDVLESKLDFARSLGATLVVNANDPDGIQKVKRATHGGVDYAFEMAGAIAALELAYRITRRGGTTVTAGLPRAQSVWPLPAVSLIAEERTIKGSYIGSCVPARDIPRYIALYQQGRLPIDRLLSERIALDDVNDAMDRLAGGQSIRQVIVTEARA
jgi:alcohol dehydrogenase